MTDLDLRKHPGLGPALKELRRRLQLEQSQVAAAVTSSNKGGPMSTNWYSKLENRINAYPTDPELDQILGVLGSSRAELATMLGIAPTPDSGEELAGAALAMTAESWSDPVLANLAPGSFSAGESPRFGSALFSALAAESPTPADGPASRSALMKSVSPSGAQHPARSSSRGAGVRAAASAPADRQELLSAYERLSEGNRKVALAYVRSLAARQSADS